MNRRQKCVNGGLVLTVVGCFFLLLSQGPILAFAAFCLMAGLLMTIDGVTGPVTTTPARRLGED